MMAKFGSNGRETGGRGGTPEALASDRPPLRSETKAASIEREAIPSFLFEGDAPSPFSEDVFGRLGWCDRKWLEEHGTAPTPYLPDAYRTLRIFLRACEPTWLYAYWDFAPDQMKASNGCAEDGALILRLFCGMEREWATDIEIHPESTHWFIPVDSDRAGYEVELGYAIAGSRWQPIARSGPVELPWAGESDQGEGAARWIMNPMASDGVMSKGAVTDMEDGLPEAEAVPPHKETFEPPPLPTGFPLLASGASDSSRFVGHDAPSRQL